MSTRRTFIYCVHFIAEERMCVPCHEDSIRVAVQKENERCVDIAKSWELSPEDEKYDNSCPQEGDGTSHNKACRSIAKAMLPPTAQDEGKCDAHPHPL